MILSVVAHALPVIVRSMPPEAIRSLPPEVIRSMPPVEVAKGPSPDWVAWVTFGAAIASAIFAGMTLIAVFRQIKIEREELTAVKDDFALSQEQFALNQQQFDLTQRQFTEFMRRPNLKTRVIRVGEPNEFDTFEDGSRPRVVRLRFYVWNSGTALSRDVLLEAYVPLEQLATLSSDGGGGSSGPITQVLGAINHPNGIQYARFAPERSNTSINVIYADGGYQMLFEMNLLFRNDCTKTIILWRAFDQYGVYPEDGEGKLAELDLTR